MDIGFSCLKVLIPNKSPSTFEPPEKKCSPEVPHGVGDDEDEQEELHDVDEGWGRLRHITDDQWDEDDVGKCSIDTSI